MNKRFFCGFLAISLAVGLSAQNSTTSPYSQYGIGLISDQSTGFSRGMNGASLGLRQGNIVNALNPASYSAIDSLTMLFDLGASGQITRYTEGATKVNTRTASLDYALGSFRLLPRLGMTFGIIPVSTIGYKYSLTEAVANSSSTTTVTYEGSGGLYQTFIGVGWQVFKPLSVGVNASYLWGSLNRSATSSATTEVKSLSRNYSSHINNYALDFGVQWVQPLGAADRLTLGATVGIGHHLGADAECKRDSSTATVVNAYALPMSYAVGLGWNHGQSLFFDVDVSLQKWGSVDYPAIGADGKYALQGGLLKDRYQVRAGLDYVPNPMGSKFYQRVHYRLGGGFTTPYYKINNNADGPKEFSLSAGFGIPLQNAYNNRSVLNISAQWVRASAVDRITENTFRLNIGITFNERWFAKWRID